MVRCRYQVSCQFQTGGQDPDDYGMRVLCQPRRTIPRVGACQRIDARYCVVSQAPCRIYCRFKHCVIVAVSSDVIARHPQ